MNSVSLAIMVRDDAERLRRCIQSAKSAVDEVVVLDTGSKDDTVDVAKEEGARVQQIEWPNNFAAALNVLASEVKTDWTLRLDSDEWFETDIKGAIQGCMAREDAYGFRLIRRDVQPDGGFDEISLLRLWRTHPDLKYQGVVHENISSSSFKKIWPLMSEKIAPIWFWHDGYGQGHLDKIRRNVALLEREVEERPGQPYYEAMLAKGYKDVGDPRWLDLMNQLVSRALSEDVPGTPILSFIFADVLNAIEGPLLKEPRTDEIILKALQWFGATPQVVLAVSNLELRRYRKKEALDALLLLEHMATTGEYDRSMPVNPSLFGKPFWKHLDTLAQQLGQWEICKRCEKRL